jgi:hypothetical protein
MALNKPTIFLSGILIAALVSACRYPALWIAPGQLSNAHALFSEMQRISLHSI